MRIKIISYWVARDECLGEGEQFDALLRCFFNDRHNLTRRCLLVHVNWSRMNDCYLELEVGNVHYNTNVGLRVENFDNADRQRIAQLGYRDLE